MLSWIRSALLDNLSLKLFALLLAIVLFRRVHQEDLVRVATVDVKLVYAFPKKLMMTSEPVNSIKVTLQAPESILTKVLAASRGWKFTVGFSDATPGPMQTELYTQEIRSIFPGQIQVTRIKPSILNVRFVERAKRRVPVEIQFKGKPPLGYKLLLPLRPYPPSVSVEGPKAIVEKLKSLKTKIIDLSSQNSDETKEVKLLHPHKYVRFLGSNVVKVMLQVHVVKGSKKFSELPIKALNFAHKKLDYELHPKQIEVTLFGPLAQLSLVKPTDIVIEADLSGIDRQKPGSHKVKVKIRPPAPDIKPLKPDRTITIRTMWRDGAAPTDEDNPDASAPPEPPARRARRRTRPKPRRRRRRRRRRNRRRRKRRPTKSRSRRPTKRKARRRPNRRRRATPPRRRAVRRKPAARRAPKRRPSVRRPVKRRTKPRKSARRSPRSPQLNKRRIARNRRGAKMIARPRLVQMLKHLPSAKLPSPHRAAAPKRTKDKVQKKRPTPPAKRKRDNPPARRSS